MEHEACPICREPMHDALTTLNCGHALHSQCLVHLRLARMPTVRNRCPVCRADISYVPVYIALRRPSDMAVCCFRCIVLLALLIFMTVLVLIIRDESS